MTEDEADEIAYAAQRNLFTVFKHLAIHKQNKVCDNLFINIAGSYLASMSPSTRRDLCFCINELVFKLGENMFEDDEDLSSFIKENFNERS